MYAELFVKKKKKMPNNKLRSFRGDILLHDISY